MKKIYTFVMFVLVATVMSAQTPVTFTVDIAGAGLTPSADGVHIAGGFQGWNPSATPLNDNGDGTFSVTLDLAPGHHEFKFINGNSWSNVEDVPSICQVELNGNDNRFIEVGVDPTSYTVCYASCALCGTNSVLLRVDMSMVDTDGDGINAEVGEDISPAGVHVAGSFNGWNPAATALTPMGNNVYGVVLPLAAGDYQYKFINGDSWGFEENAASPCFTDGNRTITVAEPNVLTETVCFGACSACLMPTTVTFRVNMSNETVSPNGVHIAGSFQNWSPSDMDWAMTDIGNNIYELTKPIPAGSYQYKFVNGNDWSGADNDNESLPAECNVGGNRSLDVTGTAMTVEYCYNQCTADCIIDPNPANITFQVNMTNAIALAAFNPAVDTLWMISGATAPQWQAGRTVMTDVDGDFIYECVRNISGPASIQYKYLAGTNISSPTIEEGAGIDATGCGIENGVGGWNRTFIRTGVDESTGAYCFDYCSVNCPNLVGCGNVTACNYDPTALSFDASLCAFPSDLCDDGMSNTINDAYNADCECVGVMQFLNTPVTFTVDIAGAGLTPSADGVHIAGNFQGWDPDSTEMISNGDGTYSITFDLLPGQYEFKFINGNSWSNVEDVPNLCQVEFNGNDNRHIEVGMDSMSYTVCYASCALCGINSVLLRVDMSMVDVDGDGINAEVGEDISPNGVHIAGNFNNWNPDSTILMSMGNNIYGVVLLLADGDYQYKFINGNSWGAEESSIGACFTEGNRTITVDAPNIAVDALCFGSCTTCLLPTNVTFRVNLSNETVSPNGVHVAGSFQNWSPGDMDWAMTDMGNNIFELTKPIAPGSYQYKFVNGNDWNGVNNDNESLPAECNVNGNRSIDVTGSEMTVEYCYNQCTANCVIDPNPANVTFQVDMSTTIAIAAFNPAVDTLWMISGATAPQWQAGRTVMTDADGDEIYECTVNISGPASFQYKYLAGTDISDPIIEEGAGIDSTGCGIDNGVGGWNRTFVRTGVDDSTGVYCFDQCTDCDGNPVIGVDEVALNNNVQVYPNPTEGLLNIAVQSTNTQDVKVEVYNAMGQFIMVEKFNKLAAGKNTLGLNLNNVPTGLYLVEVTGAQLNETFRVAVK